MDSRSPKPLGLWPDLDTTAVALIVVSSLVGAWAWGVPQLLRRGGLRGVPVSGSLDLSPGAHDAPLRSEANRGPGHLRIAVAPVLTPERTLQLYRPLAELLGTVLEMEPVLVIRGTFAAVNEQLRYRQVDIARVCDFAYLRARKDFGALAIASPVVRGSAGHRSFVLVGPSSDAASLLDLAGRTFGSADTLSTAGWLYPMSRLHEQGLDPCRFFGSHEILGSHDVVLRAVAEGSLDGAAVDEHAFEAAHRADPDLTGRLRIIERSEQFGMPPWIAHPDLDPALRIRIQRAFLMLHTRPEAKDILAALGIDRFEIPQEAGFESADRRAKSLEAP